MLYIYRIKIIISSLERVKGTKGVKNGPGIQVKITNSLSIVRKYTLKTEISGHQNEAN